MTRLIALFVFVFSVLSFAAAQDKEPFVYEVEAVNKGLPEAQATLDRETPQGTMVAFMDLGARREWVEAAHFLELTHLSETEQREQGPLLAQQLYKVIQRAVLVDWGSISDRPDAVDATATTDDPFAGKPRRSIRLALIDLPERPATIRLARLQEAGEAPVWMFPRQTVDNIPRLYAQFAPTAFEESLPSALQKQAFWTLARWEVLALPLVFVSAVAVAGLVYSVFGWAMRRAEGTVYVHSLLSAMQKPAALLALAGSFAIVRRTIFTFSGVVNAFIEPVINTAIALAIGALVVRAIDAIIERVTNASGVDVTQPNAETDREFYTTLSAVRRFLLVIILVIGGAFVLISSKLNQTLGFSLLASAGAIGLILAFGARHALGNIMASLQIAFAKTARIGDAVYFEDELAFVERIGFTHLRLRTWDGRRVMAPVAKFVSESFENWTKTDPALSKFVVLTLDHRADVGRLREAFAQWVENAEGLIEPERANVQVVDQDKFGMRVRFLFRAPDPSTAWDLHCDLREAMLRVASKLDDSASVAEEPAFLPRDRQTNLQAAE